MNKRRYLPAALALLLVISSLFAVTAGALAGMDFIEIEVDNGNGVTVTPEWNGGGNNNTLNTDTPDEPENNDGDTTDEDTMVYEEIEVSYTGGVDLMVTDDAGNEKIDDSYIWRVTHADGSIEYKNKFAAFSEIHEGDVFKLLPKVLDLGVLDYASNATADVPGSVDGTIRPSCNFTIDMRGSTVYTSERYKPTEEKYDVNRNVMQISSKSPSTVTILLEDAKLYASPIGRSFFYVTGDTEVILDGGERGGEMYAPAAFNLEATYSDPSRMSIVRNMRITRISGNMAAMLCARKTSRMLIDNCLVIAHTGAPLTVRHSGEMIVENSIIASTASNSPKLIDFNSDNSNAKFVIGNGSVLYGSVNQYDASKAKIVVLPTCYYTWSMKGYEANGTESDFGESISVEYMSVSANSKEEVYIYSTAPKTVSLKMSYVFTDSTVVSPLKTDKSMWQLTDNSGKVSYAESLAPVARPNHNYVSARLISTFGSLSPAVLYVSDRFTVDMGNAVAVSGLEYGTLFITRGEGELNLNIQGTMPLGKGSLLYAAHSGDSFVKIKGEVSAASIITARGGRVSLTGGSFIVNDTLVHSAGSVSISTVTVNAESVRGDLILAATVTIADSLIYAPSARYAVYSAGDLVLSSSVTVIGRVVAQTIDASASVSNFSSYPEASNMNGSGIYPMQKQVALMLPAIGENGIELLETLAIITHTNERYNLYDEPTDRSVWKVVLKDGSVKYSENETTPFYFISQYSELALMCDLAVKNGFDIMLSGDFKIDLSSFTLSVAEGCIPDVLFTVSGEGRFTVTSSGSAIIAPDSVIFLVSSRRGLFCELGGGTVIGRSLCSVKDSSAELSALTFVGGGEAISAIGSELKLDGCVVIGNGAGELLKSDGDVYLYGATKLAAQTGMTVLNISGTLYADADSGLYGTTSAAAFSVAKGCMFSHVPDGIVSNMPLLREKNSQNLITYTLDEGGNLTSGTVRVIYAYASGALNKGLSASFVFNTVATLCVYVPESVTSLEDFKIRIMLGGILYEADVEDGKGVKVGNTAYTRFVYPYVYPTSYNADVSVTLLADGFMSYSSASIERLVEASFAAAEGEGLKTVIATYAAFSKASLGNALPTESEMAEYVHKYSGEYGTGADLREILGYVRYNIIDGALVLGAPKKNAAYTVTYRFGTEDLTYTLGIGESELSIPIFRLAPNADISVSVEGEDNVYTFNLYDVYRYGKVGTSARTYLAYRLAYAEVLAALNEK